MAAPVVLVSDLVSEYSDRITSRDYGARAMDDEYAAYATDLKADIECLRLLRDAQVPGSQRAATFQVQIDLLTDRFTSLAGRAPALRDMDRQVADVERRRAPVAVEVGWRRGVAMRVKWPVGAVSALALAVLGVVSGWSWVAVLVVVVVAVGCGTRAWGARNLRLQAECELCSLDRELEDLRERQAQLRSGAPVVVAVAQRDRV